MRVKKSFIANCYSPLNFLKINAFRSFSSLLLGFASQPPHTLSTHSPVSQSIKITIPSYFVHQFSVYVRMMKR